MHVEEWEIRVAAVAEWQKARRSARKFGAAILLNVFMYHSIASFRVSQPPRCALLLDDCSVGSPIKPVVCAAESQTVSIPLSPVRSTSVPSASA